MCSAYLSRPKIKLGCILPEAAPMNFHNILNSRVAAYSTLTLLIGALGNRCVVLAEYDVVAFIAAVLR